MAVPVARVARVAGQLALWTAAVTALALAGCRDQPGCPGPEPGRDPDLTLRLCRAEFERTGEPGAAVAVTAALAARKDDAAIIAWARRVGELPGAAVVWRRAYQAHQRRGEREPMIAAAQRAIRLWQQAGAPGEAAYDYHTLKTAYLEQSELVSALEAARHERRLALASTDVDMQRASFADLTSVLTEIGDHAAVKALIREAQPRAAGDPPMTRALRFAEAAVHFHDGRFELARLAYRDGLAIDEAGGADVDRAALYSLVEIGVLTGDLAGARRDLAAAIATLPAEPRPHQISARAFFTALLAHASGDARRAEATLQDALARSPILDWTWQLEDLLGKALEHQGRLDDALAAYRRAIAAVETLRRDLPSDVLQVALRERKRAPYEAAFDLEARRGRRDAAMAIAELLWRRGFQDAFAASSDAGGAAADSGTAGDPSVARLRSLTRLAPELVARSAPPGAAPAPGATSAPGAPAVTAAPAGSASAAAPAGSPASAPAASPGGPPASAGSDGDVVAFIQARGALWRYTRHARPGGPGAPATLERLALPADRARRLVAELRARPDDAASAGELGAALIPPGLADAPDRPLAIVADGAVADLPFAALRVRGAWLAQRRVLDSWPSLTAGGLTAATADGAPVVLAASAPGQPELAAALRQAAGARLLHLAGHGGLGPAGAFVRMADGEVSATDIVTWRIAPRVVVLASCASGARPSGSMWGALGGAFLAAGSQAAIATLWSVEDAAAARLVRAFYAAGGARDPARALAAAQRQAIGAGVTARQWAAFAVLSAPR